ncbi:MAG: efflux RND transporter periplasmic adaptor subunit [Acidobacteriota bacterium]|jgi:RND family efflux transporter MFP subunit
MKRFFNYSFLLLAVLVAVWFVLESRNEASAPPQQGARMNTGAAEAPIVRVQEIVEKDVSQTKEYIGRVEAIDSVDLVARVSGYLESIAFVEGRYVKAGDLMFTIEKERFLAEIQSRKGSVAQIEANIVEAEKFLNRLKSAKRESVPEKDIESAQRDVDYFKAQLDSARAALDLAEIDLGYTNVRAPMSGRITIKHYSVGDYVGPNSGTIATIVQFDPIRVVCSMSEVEYLELMERTGSDPQKLFRPTLRLPNDTPYPRKGSWDFANTQIDASTGTISLRCRFPNPKGLLIPGGYVTAVLSAVKEEILPLVPQSAVVESRDGSYVFVVNENNVAEIRPIKKRSVLGTDWIVEQGLRAGETVITEGIQKARDGQAVEIQNEGNASEGDRS